MQKLRLIILLLTLPIVAFGQSTDQVFEGESYLKDCLADIPITYKKKDLDAVLSAAQKFKNIELVFLHVDKKTRKIDYQRYFIEALAINGLETAYLRLPENMNSETPQMIFPPYDPKWDRFYVASCFDVKIKEVEK
jgi:hypothetical protein